VRLGDLVAELGDVAVDETDDKNAAR